MAAIFNRRELPAASEIRRIGCLMINGIGDIVCVTPALEALKTRYPEAELSVIVRPHLRGMLEGNPNVDRVLPFETGAIWRRLAYILSLHRERFDLWVDLHIPTFNTVSSNAKNFRRNALLMSMSRARYRLAYSSPIMAKHLTHGVPVPDDATLRTENIVHTTLALICSVGPPKYHKLVPITDADRNWAKRELPAREAPRIALFFGSRQSANLWPDGHIIELVSLMVQRLPDAELVLVGGEHELELVGRIWSKLEGIASGRLRNMVAKTSFCQSAALLERCDAYVGTDSGTTHIADAVGIPIVALFASKNYLPLWRPVAADAVVLNHAVECGPCFGSDCKRGDNLCMALITPKEVLDELLNVLGR